ncbi:MAG: hypothetical protein JWR08_1216 [Enterovirga sp.]|jgi:HPr kinase/phosphorylase|nr:hypothetical protein [Enterovirga sp.]
MRDVRLHATAVVVGEAGILIRGASGSGKSTLGRRIIEAGLRVGLFARLISDDQVILRVSGARLVARAVPAVMGLVEVRALGLVRVPHVSAAVVRLIVDIGAPAARLPLETELKDTLLGIELPRITVNEFLDAEMVLWWLRCADDALVTDP